MGHGGQNASLDDSEVASRMAPWCAGDLSPNELDGPRKGFALLYAVPPDILQHRIMACLDGASLNRCALTSQKLQQFSTKQKKISADEASRSAASSDLSECATECSFGDVNTVHMVMRDPQDGTVMNQQLCGFYSRVRMTMRHNERPGLMRQFLPMPQKLASMKKGHSKGKARQSSFERSSSEVDIGKYEEASGASHSAAISSTSKQVSKRPSKRKARSSHGSASRADCSTSDDDLVDMDPTSCFADMDAAMSGTGDMKSARALAILESMLSMQQESNNAKRQRLLEQCRTSQSISSVSAEKEVKKRHTQVLIQHLKSTPTTDEWHSEQLAESQCYMCLTRPFLRKTRDHDVAQDLLFCIKCNSAVHVECLKLYGREPKDKVHWVCYYCWAARRRSKRIEKLTHYVRACSDSALDDSEFEKHLQTVKHRSTGDEQEDDETSMISPDGTGSRSSGGMSSASSALQMVTRHNRYDKWGHCAQHAASIWPLSKPYFEQLHPDDYKLLVPKSESDDIVARLARLDDPCDEQEMLT